MTNNVAHLDVNKGDDIAYYQRLVMGNYVRILAKLSASYAALAAEHDEWTARLQQEAKQPPKDEDGQLWRIRNFLDAYDEFELRLSELDYYEIDRLSENAGRHPEGATKQRRDQLAASDPQRQPRPLPPEPVWVDDGNGGLRDSNGNYSIRHKRCATAHLEYYDVYEHRDDEVFSIANSITLDDAKKWVGISRKDRPWHHAHKPPWKWRKAP